MARTILKRSLYLILSIFIFCCSHTRNEKDEFYKEKILGEQYDSKGRILKRVVTGRIPGEDIYLRITKHDTLGRIIEEYGAEPYGRKYKTSSKYDTENRIIEALRYDFPDADEGFWFENYKSDGLYKISDTVADFKGIAGMPSIFKYENTNGLIIRREYYLNFDPATREQNLKLLKIDTLENE